MDKQANSRMSTLQPLAMNSENPEDIESRFFVIWLYC
jgi:hypothetical protein